MLKVFFLFSSIRYLSHNKPLFVFIALSESRPAKSCEIYRGKKTNKHANTTVYVNS